MKKKSKNFWGQITNLDGNELEKSSEKVEISTESAPIKEKIKALKETVIESEAKQEKPKNKIKKEIIKKEELEEQWLPEGDEITGQLSVDLYDGGDSLIVESTIAGVKPEDIDISVEPDLITIRGSRKRDKQINKKNYFYQECFWGGFSRTMVLPTPVKPDGVRANIKNGILTVILPKAQEKPTNIKVK
ncbi:MAG: Hsp20/alpha crystallin family protein [Patescibacteria group bacterium]|nr:Hsp20/alpha crystallin family protein [Patescibacteria group bacterium]MDD5121204.1 Hsp20/alpha crystallin family protein [Patescibacteria group bacterium]MDD5221767.1 Hsp20/alpha crystallin family protein [Patescibacteria group bacterium]MDD5395877.1 Hsp20/alpha crystallin family protein [Patescibacteria group bacterium]